VQFTVPPRGVPSAARLRTWARAALPESGAIELVLRVVGTPEGRRLNSNFRGRDYATNVLTFAYARSPLRGDVVLCSPVIAREARSRSKSLAAHYAHLVVHGVLHLRGFDHDRASRAARMEAAERRILRSLGYGDPYVMGPPGGAVESVKRRRVRRRPE